MTALLAWLLSNPAILGLGAAIIASLGWGFHERLAGAQAERNKQAADEAAARDVAIKVDNDIGALPPDAARKELETWAPKS